MKLFLLEIDNGMEYEDYEERHKLVVAKNLADASVKAVEFMNENYTASEYTTPNFHVTAIEEVDGYKICLKESDE